MYVSKISIYDRSDSTCHMLYMPSNVYVCFKNKYDTSYSICCICMFQK